MGSYRFRLKWPSAVFFISMICLTIGLGNWQVQRYYDKKNILVNDEKRQHEGFQDLSTLYNQPLSDLQGRRVRVDGDYQNHETLFLDNQIVKGKSGVEVLTPIRINGSKKLLLVDRGWVKSPVGHWPSLPPILGQAHLQGKLKVYNEYQFILGDNVLHKTQPYLLQKIDFQEIEAISQHAFYPFVLRLGEGELGALERHWQLLAVTPERHLAYAVQWFLMALVLSVSFIIFCREKSHES